MSRRSRRKSGGANNMSFNRDLPFWSEVHFVKRRHQTPSYAGTTPRIAAAEGFQARPGSARSGDPGTPSWRRRSASRPYRSLRESAESKESKLGLSRHFDILGRDLKIEIPAELTWAPTQKLPRLTIRKPNEHCGISCMRIAE